VFCCQPGSRFPTSTPSSLTIVISRRERGGRAKERVEIICNAYDLQLFVSILGVRVRVRVIVRVVFVLIKIDANYLSHIDYHRSLYN
jgi:hypothetical protein